VNTSNSVVLALKGKDRPQRLKPLGLSSIAPEMAQSHVGSTPLFEEAHHGGIEFVPHSDLEVVPTSYQQHITPIPTPYLSEKEPMYGVTPLQEENKGSGLELSPVDGMEVMPTIYQEIKTSPRPDSTFKEALDPTPPPEATSQAKRFKSSPKCLLLAFAILIILLAALGGGMGGGLTHRNSQKPLSANTTTSSLSLSTSTSTQTIMLSGIHEPTSITLPGRVTAADPQLNDQLSTTGTAIWWYFGQTSNTINNYCAQFGARITQIRVDDATTPTFTAILVSNSSVYASASSWVYGVNSTELSALETDNRFISFDPYFDAQSNLQFAAVMVPNQGAQNRTWWWYYGLNSSGVDAALQQNNARLVTLRSYNEGNTTLFAVILAANTGTDYITSQWYHGISIEDIASKVASGFRLISLSPSPSGNWDTILVSDDGIEWGWWYNFTNADVLGSTVSETNLRPIDISPYTSAQGRRFAVVYTNNNGES
jgi:hypothetical protein